MHVDSELRRLATAQPNKKVQLVVECEPCSGDIQEKIEKTGFMITGRGNAEFGLLFGAMPAGKIDHLNAVPEVLSVTADGEERALETGDSKKESARR